MERRNDIRYGLKAIAAFSWEDSGKHRFEGEGVTGDISVASAYILSQVCPPRGATVQMVILLPRIPDTDLNVTIQIAAKVVRVDCSAEVRRRNGFAIAAQVPDINGFQMVCTRDDETCREYRAKAG